MCRIVHVLWIALATQAEVDASCVHQLHVLAVGVLQDFWKVTRRLTLELGLLGSSHVAPREDSNLRIVLFNYGVSSGIVTCTGILLKVPAIIGVYAL